MLRNHLLAGTPSTSSDRRPVMPRMRVVIDNDFSGDPDDLFQTAQHLLSPSVEIPLLIASHLSVGDPWDPTDQQAANARERLDELLEVMGIAGRYTVETGAERGLVDRTTPQDTPAARALIAEAHRESDLPLYVACGAGLTELASAWLIDPSIASRLTLVWIGGPEHDDLSVPSAATANPIEYNQRIDPIAAQVIFNDSDIRIWQVPRDTYRRQLVTHAELQRHVAASGTLGRYLVDQTTRIQEWTREIAPIGETYVMGDSPLVTLTALQSSFQPEPSSCRWVARPTPAIDDAGAYVARDDAREIRIYTDIDMRVMWEDLVAKLSLWSTAN